MQNKKDTDDVKEVELGHVELVDHVEPAENVNEGGIAESGNDFNDIRQGKMNSADTLSGGFPQKDPYSDGGRKSSNMKMCFVGLTLTGILAIIIVIIAIAAGDDDRRRGRNELLQCPAYYYMEGGDDDKDSDESETNTEDETEETASECDTTDGDGTCIPGQSKTGGRGGRGRGGRGRGRGGRARRAGNGTCVMATCDFRTEVMTDYGKGCEKCEAGKTPNGVGTKCVKDNCKQYQFLNQDGTCEECPAAYFKASGKCFQADRNKIDMVQTFNKNPDFAHYSNVHQTTQNIAQFFDMKMENYAGSITEPYSTSGLPVESPLVPMIAETQVAGPMMYIHQIQEEPQSPYFMDIWFANSNTDSKVVETLRNLSQKQGTKCCWTNKETGKSLSKHFTGFARIVEYADYQRNGASPEYAFKITEGQIQKGYPNGFARVISGFEGKMDFGFFKDSSRLTIDEGAADKTPEFYMTQVNKLIKENKMVVFTKSYCPYSKALRKMLDAHGLEGQYKVYEIDRENHGNEVHKAIKDKTGRLTIPNVFLMQENLGGDEEVEAMAKDGSLKPKLQAADLYNTF